MKVLSCITKYSIPQLARLVKSSFGNFITGRIDVVTVHLPPLHVPITMKERGYGDPANIFAATAFVPLFMLDYAGSHENTNRKRQGFI